MVANLAAVLELFPGNLVVGFCCDRVKQVQEFHVFEALDFFFPFKWKMTLFGEICIVAYPCWGKKHILSDT